MRVARSVSSCVLGIFVLSTLFVTVSGAQQLPAAQSATPQRKAPPPPPAPPAVDQEQFIAYWTTETGWNTELQLRNNTLGQDLTVTPVLRLPDGAETPLAPVTIKSQEVKSVDVAAATYGSPQLIGTYGSVVLRYRSSTFSSLYAVAMVMGIGHSIAFHIDANGGDQTENVGSREGIWWLPNSSVNDYLILTNQGANLLQLALSLFDATGKPSVQNFTLPPGGMNRLSVRQLVSAAKLSGSYGGIKVSATAHAGSLDTLHILFDGKAGFSAVMKMFFYDPRAELKERDYAATGKWTMHAPMLALSNPDTALAFPVGTTLRPQLLIHNNIAKPADAGLLFNWHSDSANGQTAPTTVRLGPFETQLIDVTSLQNSKAIPQDGHWASVTLTTNGLPGEVSAVAASYDRTLKYGAQTPFSDQLAFHWAGSQWQYDPYHDSIITVGNGGTKATQAAFTILYNQGTQKYELEQSLQPDEQMWIDVGKLIRLRMPDKNGKTLPADLTSGSYDIRDLSGKAIGTLFEGKVIYDKTYGHVTYGCGECCAFTYAKFWWNPLGIPTQGTSDNGVNGHDGCTNTFEDISGCFYGNWSTANSSIATADTYGTHTGHAVGSTTSSTWGQIQIEQTQWKCPIENYTPGGSDNVKPTISGPNTLWWFNGLGLGVSGYTTQITLTANAGGSSGSYQWSITAGSDKVSLSASTSSTVQVTSIGQSTTTNDVSITVTVGGVTSDPFKLTVRAPYTLGTDSLHPTPVYLTDNTYVWQTQIYYTVLDNLLNALPTSVDVNENWNSPLANDYTGTNWRQPSPNADGCGMTNVAELKDSIFGEVPSRIPTPVYSANPNGVAVQHWGQEWRIGTCNTGFGPRVVTDTLQKYTDHAAYTYVTTPAP